MEDSDASIAYLFLNKTDVSIIIKIKLREQWRL